jgi:hypothetical protein
LSSLLLRGIDLVPEELDRATAADPEVRSRLLEVAARLDSPEARVADLAETLWTLFFPEGVGIRGHEARREADLRTARTVTISAPALDPIADPARELLLTSNVLLTLPSSTTAPDALPYPAEVRADLAAAAVEPQRFWFDHPIQIGVAPEGNELLYGLHALDDAIEFERRRGSVDRDARSMACVLSVSVTHDGLHQVARPYIEAELGRSGGLRNLDVYAFTEADTRRLIDEVLAPAAASEHADTLLRDVFGVDGEYGRHYSFLKAIAALWHVLIDPRVRATFKIDLDQVFPQEVLVAETGASAFEHLGTPLWGAVGTDAAGDDVDLGMIAGALVNERDIGRGLFTPDVAYPTRPPTLDEHVFFSVLPQALSTAAEMMERHDSPERDGIARCIERVHVTGGTNGIRVDALRRHRPFTPSFIGRAEDQAYVLSTYPAPGPRLAYAHAAGLVMRHDKEAFAGEAIAAAHAGKLVGDDVRILQFSGYAEALGVGGGGVGGRLALKSRIDPFTGCFVSALPVTVTLLRFVLRTARLLREDPATGRGYATIGARRIGAALDDVMHPDGLRRVLDRERAAWGIFHDTLDTLESRVGAGDPEALRLRERARVIVRDCLVTAPAGPR